MKRPPLTSAIKRQKRRPYQCHTKAKNVVLTKVIQRQKLPPYQYNTKAKLPTNAIEKDIFLLNDAMERQNALLTNAIQRQKFLNAIQIGISLFTNAIEMQNLPPYQCNKKAKTFSLPIQ